MASFLSFFSGFGLGTILMPAMAIFFPLPLAIGLTAIVHLLHNVLKSSLLWKAIDWKTALRFGSVAFLFSIFGAFALKGLTTLPPLFTYKIFYVHGEITLLKIAIGLLLLAFASFEIFPKKIFQIHNLYLGGAISGFFGGLSGNQGAFRSIFLIQMHFSKETFIATNAIIAAGIDTIRLIIYGISFWQLVSFTPKTLLFIAISSAIAGVVLGMLLLRKITLSFIQNLIFILLLLFGFLFIAGIL